MEKQGDRNPLTVGDQLLKIVERRNRLEIRGERKELILIGFDRFLKDERRTSIIERMSVETREEEEEEAQ